MDESEGIVVEGRANENCNVETQQFRGRSILVWAGISMYTKTQIVRIHGNLKCKDRPR